MKKEHVITILIIVAVVTFLSQEGQKQIEFVDSTYETNAFGFDWICTAGITGEPQGTESDFSDGHASFSWTSNVGSVILDASGGNTLFLQSKSTGEGFYGGSVNCRSGNFDASNIERIDLLMSGEACGNGDSGTGTGVSAIGLGRSISPRRGDPRMCTSIANMQVVKLPGENRWFSTDALGGVEITLTDNSMEFGTGNSVDDGSTDAAITLFNIQVTCEQGFTYNGQGRCISDYPYPPLLSSVSNYHQGIDTFSTFITNANKWVN